MIFEEGGAKPLEFQSPLTKCVWFLSHHGRCKGTVHFQHRLRHGVATPAVAVQHRLRHGHATPAVAAQLRLHLRITSSSSASLRSLSLPTVQSFLTHT